MILDLQISKDNGLITSLVSAYKPDQKEKDRLKEILADFVISKGLRDRPWAEFNDKTLIERQSEDQKTFNTYIEPKSTDPTEKWKSDAKRPIARNRIIAIAAHITKALIYPLVFAQNDQDEEDKGAGIVMRDLMEWASEMSNYVRTFFYAVIAALVNPAVIIHTEYAEHYKKIKEIDEKGGWKEKEILDETLSGFKDTVVPVDELFISDIYEHDIQKQGWLIWRRAIDWNIAYEKYGDKPNFKYVKRGLQVLFDEASDTFYEQFDENLRERLVEEIIYYNRTKDLQIVVLNGVMIDNPDQPNPRKDKLYPFGKSGYELVDEGKFFYYSSLAKNLFKDQEIINELYRMVIDAGKLQVAPPAVAYGSEAINSRIMIPNAITSFKNPEAKLEALNLGANINSGLSLIQLLEKSISESSQDVLQAGMSTPGQQTAFEISRLEQNAQIMLGMFAKMIGFLVRDFGYLRIGDIVQFITVGELEELVGGETKMKYKTILMPNKNIAGKNRTRKIVFNQEEITDMPRNERGEMLDWEGLRQEGGLDGDIELCKVNPQLFRKLKFNIIVRPEAITPPSDRLQTALNLELYDRAIQNPNSDKLSLYQDVLLGSYEKTRDNVDKYTLKPEEQMPPEVPQGQPSVLNKLFGKGKEQALNTAVA